MHRTRSARPNASAKLTAYPSAIGSRSTRSTVTGVAICAAVCKYRKGLPHRRGSARWGRRAPRQWNPDHVFQYLGPGSDTDGVGDMNEEIAIGGSSVGPGPACGWRAAPDRQQRHCAGDQVSPLLPVARGEQRQTFRRRVQLMDSHGRSRADDRPARPADARGHRLDINSETCALTRSKPSGSASARWLRVSTSTILTPPT